MFASMMVMLVGGSCYRNCCSKAERNGCLQNMHETDVSYEAYNHLEVGLSLLYDKNQMDLISLLVQTTSNRLFSPCLMGVNEPL